MLVGDHFLPSDGILAALVDDSAVPPPAQAVIKPIVNQIQGDIIEISS